MGSLAPAYSVQDESSKILQDGILSNPLLSLPSDLDPLAKNVTFTGNPSPSIPINWRFAESAAALKAFEASMLNLLITKKYGVKPEDLKVTINTDHASLYVMSPMIARMIDDQNGEVKQVPWGSKEMHRIFPNRDLHRASASVHRTLATNIYRTKDGRFYHCHGSMNPEPTLTALGLPLEGEDGDTYDSCVKKVQSVVETMNSADIDHMMNEKYRQAGTICWSTEEFKNSEHGKANAHATLYELHKGTGGQKAGWWEENSSYPSSLERPLAGLKVVDLTRVIAAPSITRGLAQMGASVMRVTSDKVTDMSSLFHDLSWGKWQCSLHLKDEADREKLKELIKEADVVVEGYRPGVMEKYGLSRKDIFELVKDRERGIIHVKENCYGWHGPWQHRSGWQQISDACCGVSLEFGRAMGNDEAVTPVFPNSDFCTGIAGSTGVLQALIERAEKGGSYYVDASLNYYSQWLVNSVGVYPDDVWKDVWGRHGNPVFRHYHAMQYTIPALLKLLHEHDGKVLFRDEYFENAESKAVGKTLVPYCFPMMTC
jgi:hypothetical protein